MADTENAKVFQITTQSGISRDGTVLDRSGFVDGQWVRFQRGRPRKMGGYKEIASNVGAIVRDCYVHPYNNLIYIYGFAGASCWTATTTQDGASSVASEAAFPGLTAGDHYTFQSSPIFDAVGTGIQQLMVHPASNIEDIASRTNTPIYALDLGTNPGTLTALDDGAGNPVEVSGGVVVLQPFVFAYGNDGLIKNCDENNPNLWTPAADNLANEVNVAGTKIVKGLPIRGGSSSPAGLFWSLDSVIKVSRAGVDFRYDGLTGQSSILAQNSPIEYDGVFYWIGVDRFLMYDGTVHENPNDQNLNWFFDNVNYAARTKIWATKNTRFGEIWWFFPFGEATECTHAIIYNIREKSWYDVELGRSAGFPTQVFRYPVMYDTTMNRLGTYSTYIHEFGTDAIRDGSQVAIRSFFETSDFGFPTGGAEGEQLSGSNQWTRVERVEPDFIMAGDMSLVVTGESYAQETTVDSALFPFNGNTGKIDLREQRRQIRLRFISNSINGTFQMGRTILHLAPGDNRS